MKPPELLLALPAGSPSAAPLLTLYPVLLHLLDFGDRLPQVVGKLLAVLRIGCVEVDEDFDVCSRNGRGQADSVWIIYRVTSHIFEEVVQLEQRDGGFRGEEGTLSKELQYTKTAVWSENRWSIGSLYGRPCHF